jgi:hypothetical protein
MQLPDFRRKWAGRAALIIAILLAIAAIIYNRISSAHASTAQAVERLADAAVVVTEIRTASPGSIDPIDVRFMNRIKSESDRAKSSLDEIPALTSEPSLLAQAAVLRGDLNLALAQIPRIPGATTQPALELPESRETYSSNADHAYKEVLSKYADQPVYATAAHFGLAALAENKYDWQDAINHYQAIMASDASSMFKLAAQNHLKLLDQIRQPALLVPGPTTALITPTTQPAFPSATQPATRPTTQPFAPPSTRPSLSNPTTNPITNPKTNPK